MPRLIPKVDDCEDSIETHSAEDIEQVIKKLKGNDRIGSAGQILTTFSGAATGGVAAGSIATAAGASTLLGSTTLASALGGIFVLTTPVGWIAGCMVAGAATAYGISKMVKSGGRNDKIREELISKLSKRLADLNAKNSSSLILAELQQSIAEAVRDGHLSTEDAYKVINLVELGKLKVEIALMRIKSLNLGE